MGFFTQLAAAPQMARLLGFAGLIPFIFAGSVVWISALEPLNLAMPLLATGYGAVILSFLGGVRWGAAMAVGDARENREIALSVIPSLIGFACMIVPLISSLVLLLVSFAALGVTDMAAARDGRLAPWYAPLRLVLTVIVCVSLLSVLVFTLTNL